MKRELPPDPRQPGAAHDPVAHASAAQDGASWNNGASSEGPVRDRPQRPRPGLLFGETLHWVTYDQARTVSAGLRSMLRESLGRHGVQLETAQTATAEEAANLVQQHRAGLLTLVLTESDWSGPDLGGACRALRRVQVRRSNCVRCVYVPQVEMASDLRLFEAGAQIVVDQIPWLQRLVPRIIELAPRRSGGNHPIIAGLVDRLPWQS